MARLPGPERGVSESQPQVPRLQTTVAHDVNSLAGAGGLGVHSCSVSHGNMEWFALDHFPISPVSRANAHTGSPGSPSRSGRQGGFGTVAGCLSNDLGLFNLASTTEFLQDQNTLSGVFHPGLPSCFFSAFSCVCWFWFVFSLPLSKL